MHWKDIEVRSLHLRYLSKVEEKMHTEVGFGGIYKWHVAECWMTSGLCCPTCGEPSSLFFYLITPVVIHHEFDPSFEAVLLGPKPDPRLPDETHKLDVLAELWKYAKALRRLPIPHIRTDEITRVR